MPAAGLHARVPPSPQPSGSPSGLHDTPIGEIEARLNSVDTRVTETLLNVAENVTEVLGRTPARLLGGPGGGLIHRDWWSQRRSHSAGPHSKEYLFPVQIHILLFFRFRSSGPLVFIEESFSTATRWWGGVNSYKSC